MVALFLALMGSFPVNQGQKVLFQTELAYRSAPIDNPLKGLVPYAGDRRATFPHSMEFSYLSLNELMTGPESFDWTKLEDLLNSVAKRGHQTIFRVTIEYPGQPSGVPGFLIQKGLKFIKFPDPGSNDKSKFGEIPDYKNPDLQSALVKFIDALGAKYDGDPRIGFITAGLLGYWGEWHNYPQGELSPSKELQEKVLSAYEQSFRKTPILLRYPRRIGDSSNAGNAHRPFGYHDDSFAWATLDTGKPEDSWFFMSGMKQAGQAALDKWKSHPIGGEIRPEAWGIVFDQTPGKPEVQDFDQCVQDTHVTWLMDSGMFNGQVLPGRVASAMAKVGKMGYEYSVLRASGHGSKGLMTYISIDLKNTGVAPFYAKWSMEIAQAGKDGSIVSPQKLTSNLPKVLPKQIETLKLRLSTPIRLNKGSLLLRVVNPLSGGIPFRFANASQDADVNGWLTLKRNLWH